MYKNHKIIGVALFVMIFLVTVLLKADYSKVAESAISVVAIALAVYIGATSVILGSDFAEKLKKQQDSQIKTKTSLGVFATYLRIAGFFSFATIVISVLYMLNLDLWFLDNFFAQWKHYSHFLENLAIAFSAFSFSMFSVNIFFIWLILKFLINSMTKSV